MERTFRPGGIGGQLLAAPEPQRKTALGKGSMNTPVYMPGFGTGKDMGAPIPSELGRWLARWGYWRDEVERHLAPKWRRYWSLWRNFDYTGTAGPGQEWRDRTVVPEPFKIIMTRMAKLFLGVWGRPEWYTVEGRGFRDQDYEDTVREVMDLSLDEIGRGTPDGELFLKRMYDAELYCQVMGHVWYGVFWRTETDTVKTKLPRLNEDGSIEGWDPIEFMETMYDNIDIQWRGLDSIAADLSGANRWFIERISTTLEDLKAENLRYAEANGGRQLYEGLLDLEMHSNGSNQKESYEEPRDTERWPLAEDEGRNNPGMTSVELWLCWDNVNRTLTKIANRRVVLAHGLAPTATGKAPWFGVPAVPIPGRVYGDSMLNWVGPLAEYQTRIARARGDEILINLWQQYLARAGVIRSSQLFWRPGGIMEIEADDMMDRPVTDLVSLLPRRPVFQEAWREEGYRQQQAEATANADAISQGVEATQKSRDVSAQEIQARTSGAMRPMQMEQLYRDLTLIKPLMQRAFDELRMNMTRPKLVKLMDDQDAKAVDLRDLNRPVDIVVGGAMLDVTQQEKLAELREVRDLMAKFPHWFRERAVLLDTVKNMRSLGRRTRRYIKTEEEVQRAMAQQQAQEQAQEMAGGAPPAAGGQGPSIPGGEMLPGPTGPSGPPPEAGSDGSDEVVTEV